MNTLALYVRKSWIDREDGIDTASIQAQERAGRAWAKRNGYEVVHVYKDNASAFDPSKVREDYDQALAALAAGNFDALWCPAVDRFSRQGARSVLDILDAGRRVIFEREGLDTVNGEQVRMMLINYAEMARTYSVQLSATMRRTRAFGRDAGLYSGRAPYGFTKVGPRGKRYLAVEPAEWATVARIYREAAEGRSLRKIAAGLNADGLRTRATKPNPDGADWSARTVRRILLSPVYEGWQIIEVKSGDVPRLYLDEHGQRVKLRVDGETIPAELAERARATMTGQRPPHAPGRGRRTSLLAGLARCAGCQGALVAGGRSYYCLRNQQGQTCPAPASISRVALEGHVSREWGVRVANLGDDLSAFVARFREIVSPPETTAETTAARQAVAAAKTALQEHLKQASAGLWEGMEADHARELARRQRAFRAAQDALAAREAAGATTGRLTLATLLADATERQGLELLIGAVTVTRAAKRGARFSADRVVIDWVDPPALALAA